MKTSTKILGLALAGSGLLLTACEIPGGGEPPRVIVIPNLEGRTDFSGFPATFTGTNVIRPEEEVNAEELDSAFDEYLTTVSEPTDLVIECDQFSEGTTVYVDSDDADTVFVDCNEDATGTVTVDGGVYIDIHNYNDAPGIYPYVISADISDAD